MARCGCQVRVTRGASLRWIGRPHAHAAGVDLGLSALSPVDWSRELFCIGCVYPVPSAVSLCLPPAPPLPFLTPSVSFFRPREKEETLCLFCALGTLNTGMASGTRGRAATQVSQPPSFTFARSFLAIVSRISKLIFK